MMRRILLKLLLAAVACIVLLVTSICVAAYLAFQPPSFYAELLARQPRTGEVAAVEQRLEQMGSDFRRWRARAVSTQQRRADAAGENGQGNPIGTEAGKVAEEDGYTLRFSEDDMNALLASDKYGSERGELRDPRIRFDEGQIVLAFTLATPAGDVVLSAAFEPRPPTDDEARFRLARVRVGRLPLPISTMSHLAPKRKTRLNDELYLDATGSALELVFRMSEGERDAARPQSIECTDGELILRLTGST